MARRAIVKPPQNVKKEKYENNLFYRNLARNRKLLNSTAIPWMMCLKGYRPLSSEREPKHGINFCIQRWREVVDSIRRQNIIDWPLMQSKVNETGAGFYTSDNYSMYKRDEIRASTIYKQLRNG